MGKKSKVIVEESTSSCPNNDESAAHIQEKRKRKKNKIFKTCETEANERLQMVKKSKVKVEVEPTSSCPNNDNNDECAPHIQGKTKRKKNKIVKTCEPEANECDTNVDIKESVIPIQLESAMEPIDCKKNKCKNGTSPEDEPIDEAELDAYCGELDEEANSTLASWINLLEAKLSEGNSTQNAGKKKKRKRIKATVSNDASETQEQASGDSVQKKIKK